MRGGDRLERYALALWRRWVRVARYALQTTRVDAQLRYRIRDHHEVRKAVEDLLAGREGLVHMLARARRTARGRLRVQIERQVLQAATTVGVGEGREVIARAVRRAGYAVGSSTVRRILKRRGLWPDAGSDASVRDRGHPYKTRSPRPGCVRCTWPSPVRKEKSR